MTIKPRYHEADFFKHFWERGTGRYMINWTGANVSLRDFDAYAHLYHKVDDAGDDAARALFFDRPFADAMKLAETCASKPVTLHNDVPDGLKNMLMSMQQTPEWLDRSMLNVAAKFSCRAGLNALIVLRDFTLMGGYDYAYLNKPLIFTGALKKGAVKRLRDTLHFWTSVTRPGALETFADGYRFCVATRLIHSYSRIMILDQVKEWDTQNWGLPVNSWDMIATYIGFSLTFLLGLKRLNIKVSREEEDCVFHLWKYVGHLIGIPHQYIPNNAKEATEQFYLWSSVQPGADDDSVLLAKALLDENLITPVYDEMSKRRRLKYLHTCCIWHLLDKEVNERLNIPRVPAASLFPAFLMGRNQLYYSFTNKEKQFTKGDKTQREILRLYLEKA